MNDEELYNHIASTMFIRAIRNSMLALDIPEKTAIANQALDDADLFMVELKKRASARNYIGS